MRNRISIAYLILFLSFAAGCTSEEATSGSAVRGTISGAVTDATAAAGFSVTVSPTSASSKTSPQTKTTDSSGAFSFRVRYGCYQIAITKSGYRDRGFSEVCIDADTSAVDLGDLGLSLERQYMMSGSSGSHLLMAGGEYSGSYLTTVEILNVVTGELIFDILTRRRARGATATADGKIFIAGGKECDGEGFASGTCRVSSLVEIYNVSAKTWATASLSTARADLSAATTTDGYVVFAGGITDTAVSGTVDIYEVSTGTWTTATLPVPRSAMGVVASGTKVYFAGGFTLFSGNAQTNRVDIFEPSSGAWTTANLSISRSSIAAVKAGDKLIFAGGEAGCSSCVASNAVEIYDTTMDTWTATTLSTSRNLVSAASDGTIAVFAGGEDGDPLDTVDIYDSSTDSWSESTLSEARSHIPVIVVSGKAYFVGGHIALSGFSNVIDIFDFATKSFSDSLF